MTVVGGADVTPDRTAPPPARGRAARRASRGADRSVRGARRSVRWAGRHPAAVVVLVGAALRVSNDSTDSVKITLGTVTVAYTSTNPSRLGTMCSNTMRGVETPMARAASTNSILRKDKVCPRTSRAVSIHENAVMASTTR